MARTSQDRMLEELQAAGSPDFWNRPEVRSALAEQGINFPRTPGSDASNPFTGDDEGPATTDTNGVTAVSAVDTEPGEDELDALTASVGELQQATRDRRAADTLKRTQPETDAAARQAIADRIQRSLGTAQRVSQVTQGGIRNRVLTAADRLGAVPTPGGIAGLVVILLVLLLILVEVGGQPRLVWLWLVLTRRAHLRSEQEAATGVPSNGAIPQERGDNVRETVPALSNLGVLAVNTQTHPADNSSPINLLSAARGDLNRYLNL
jgi:hypothetical protein